MKKILPVGRVYKQKAGVLGPVAAWIVGATETQTVTGTLEVVFTHADGRFVRWPIDLSNNSSEACCALIPGRLIVSSRENGTNKSLVREYKIETDPFVSAPVRVQGETLFGNSDCRGSELVVLKNGQVACVTYTHNSIGIHAAVRAIDGAWIVQGYLPMPTKNYDPAATAHTMAATALPWENALAVWIWTDGGFGLDLGIFAIDLFGRLVLKKGLPGWINRENINGQFTFGAMTPNGEIPSLWAVTDGSRVLISLCNNDGKLLHTTEPGYRPDQNAAHPIIVAMGSDYKPVLHRVLDAIVVSIMHPMPLVAGDEPSIVYFSGYPFNRCEMVTGNSYTQIPCNTRNILMGCHPSRREVLFQQADKSVALESLDLASPLPEPIPEPTANVVSSRMCYLSWSGADPTNSGSFVLQSAPAKTGPWSDVTDHWPYAFQSKDFTPADAAVVTANGLFFRLKPK